MHGSYVESFKDLYHGTIESFAASIVETQTFIPSKEGWCGPGVYFYDNKSKAWWSACRTCRYEKEKGNNDAIADIVIADIKPLKKELILDLRAPKDLETFANFVNTFLSQNNFESEENIDPLEWLKQKRAMLLSFYCQENNIQLIVGYFKQQSQGPIDAVADFADSWQLAIGIETIYCAKSTAIVHNIRRRR